MLAEDTRHTRKLLVHYGIRTQLLSLHEHNEHSRVTQVLQIEHLAHRVACVQLARPICDTAPHLHCHAEQVLDQLAMGASLALVSDAGEGCTLLWSASLIAQGAQQMCSSSYIIAGMPSISDPGSRIISAAIAGGHRVIPLPGASAAITALVASGLPADDFRFLGFLPPKSGARQRRLQELAGQHCCNLRCPHGCHAVWH